MGCQQIVTPPSGRRGGGGTQLVACGWDGATMPRPGGGGSDVADVAGDCTGRGGAVDVAAEGSIGGGGTAPGWAGS